MYDPLRKGRLDKPQPSLWYKSSVEDSSDPARTAAEDPASSAGEHISLDRTTDNCSLTLSGNHDDSHALKALAENSTSLSTKGCDTFATGMVPKGHDSLAPSGVPETSTSGGAVCRASPSVEPKGRDSPIQIMSRENSATCCVKKQDPFVARMAPIVRDGLLRTASGKSASLAVEVSNSVAPSMGPPGYASLAPTNASKSCGIFAPGFSPKSCESLVPSLALGNSKCIGVKGLSSAPRMTPEGQEFLSLSIAPQSPVLHSGKGHDDSTSGATRPVHVPGHGNSSPLTTEGRDYLELSIAPKGHDPPASSNKPKCHEAPTSDTVPESQPSQAPGAATKGYNAPTITGDSKDQIAQCGAHNKSSGAGVEASSNVARAADTLIALSTPREEGR